MKNIAGKCPSSGECLFRFGFAYFSFLILYECIDIRSLCQKYRVKPAPTIMRDL